MPLGYVEHYIPSSIQWMRQVVQGTDDDRLLAAFEVWIKGDQRPVVHLIRIDWPMVRLFAGQPPLIPAAPARTARG